MLFQTAGINAAQALFRETHKGEGHTTSVQFESILDENGNSTPSKREITTCSCGGERMQVKVGDFYLDPH